MRCFGGRAKINLKRKSKLLQICFLGLIAGGCRDCRSKRADSLPTSQKTGNNRHEDGKSKKKGTVRYNTPRDVDLTEYAEGTIVKLFDSCKAVKESCVRGDIFDMAFLGEAVIFVKRSNGPLEKWDLNKKAITSRVEEKSFGHVAVSRSGKYIASSSWKQIRLRKTKRLGIVWQKVLPCVPLDIRFAAGQEPRVQVLCPKRIYEIGKQGKAVEIVSSQYGIIDWLNLGGNRIATIEGDGFLVHWEGKSRLKVAEVTGKIMSSSTSSLHKRFVFEKMMKYDSRRVLVVDERGKKISGNYRVKKGFESTPYVLFVNDKDVILTADFYIGPVDPRLGYEKVRYFIRWWDIEKGKDIAWYKINRSINPVAVSQSGLRVAYEIDDYGCMTVLELRKKSK